MPLKPSANPVFAEEIPALTVSSVAHPDTWNPIHQMLLDSTVYLRAAVVEGNKTLGGKVAEIAKRLDGVESTSSVAVQTAVGLDWMYRNNAITFELFTAGYTLIDVKSVAVVEGVLGGDALDVANTAVLKVNDYYVLSEPTAVDGDGKPAPASELVQVIAILSAQRVRLAANLRRNWGAKSVLARSAWEIASPGRALASVGSTYLSRSINIGTAPEGGAVVIRRTQNAGEIRLYYRDATRPNWTECGWSFRRTGGAIPATFGDYEYILPMRGEGSLRAEVVGEPMTVAHIVAVGKATGLGGFLNPELRPDRPVMSYPADNAVGVMERPTLALAGYSSPMNNAQTGVRFQLSKTADFAQVAHDSGEQPAGLSYQIPASVLAVSTLFYVRGAVKDVAGQWSENSLATRFTTAASYAYVAAPVMNGPANNAMDVPAQPTLSTQAFALVGGGSDTHTASRWRIRSALGTYASPAWDSGEDAVNKLNIIPPAGLLAAGQSVYFAQVQHKGAAKGWSEWSSEIKFTTKANFANVIGLVQIASGGGSGAWARVDENGAPKATDAAFFASHPTFGAVQDQVIDGQAMVRIPAFYVKRGVIAAGVYAGKKAVWISDQPAAGFELHPAFKDAGNNLTQFWVGKYLAAFADGKLTSLPATAVDLNYISSTMRAWAAARNVGGVTGFSIWNVYQLAALQTLMIIEIGGTDVQVLLGQGNGAYELTTSTSAGSLSASWRGIIGLWGTVFQALDGLRVNANNAYQIWDRQGNKVFQTTKAIAPSVGTIVSMSEDAGPLYDLRDVFAPATTDSAGNDQAGSYGRDIIYAGNGASEAWVGGSAKVAGAYGYQSGIFMLGVSWGFDNKSPYQGTRLAKI